jgi:hypothetical protein
MAVEASPAIAAEASMGSASPCGVTRNRRMTPVSFGVESISQ